MGDIHTATRALSVEADRLQQTTLRHPTPPPDVADLVAQARQLIATAQHRLNGRNQQP